MNLILKVEMIYKQNKNNKEKEYKNYNKCSKCYTNGCNKPLGLFKFSNLLPSPAAKITASITTAF